MSPDYSHGYLRVPLSVWLAVFCRGSLTRRQLQLAAVVIRESWGWQTGSGQVHTWTRPLSTRQFADATGLSSDHLRRDLHRLIGRGVLNERQGRYQFVAAVDRWITPTSRPQETRGPAPEWPDRPAESALSPLASKKVYTKQRNVAAAPEGEFSTAGENPSSRSSHARPQPQAGAARISATAALRLVEVITAFVGSLSPSDAEALHLWISEDGVASVWSALEPSFRTGAAAGRRRLKAILAFRERQRRR